MTELTELTIAEAREGLKRKDFSAVELAKSHLEAIEAANAALNTFVLVTQERALEMAKASDARLNKGEGGALEGIPLGIKDLFCTKGVRTTACSHILDGFTPPYESTVTANLWAEGAVMLGKLNNDEFAMGSSNETSFYGPVVNPWRRNGSDAKLVPGGSSGGSAVAMRARAAFTYFSSRSMPTKARPRRLAAAPVVPLPVKGSRTISPGRLEASNTRWSRASGFWVGCSLSPFISRRRSGPVHSGISQSERICKSSFSAFMAS